MSYWGICSIIEVSRGTAHVGNGCDCIVHEEAK